MPRGRGHRNPTFTGSKQGAGTCPYALKRLAACFGPGGFVGAEKPVVKRVVGGGGAEVSEGTCGNEIGEREGKKGRGARTGAADRGLEGALGYLIFVSRKEKGMGWRGLGGSELSSRWGYISGRGLGA